jgi:hypothetical protein
MSFMSERTSHPNIPLIQEVAFAAVLWAVTFVATKSDSFGHRASLGRRIALLIVGVGGFLPVV